MRAWIRRIQAARQRRAAEETIAALYRRRKMILAVDAYGAYVRIYVPCAMGVMALSPRTAERHLLAIEDREFERALAR